MAQTIENAYYNFMQLDFQEKPELPWKFYLGIDDNVPTVSSKELLLSENELESLSAWCESLLDTASSLSEGDSIHAFDMRDHDLLQDVYDRVVKHFDINKEDVQPEKYMKNYIHYLNLSSSAQLPFVHDVNIESNRVNVRLCICIKKTKQESLSGMPYFNNTIHAVDEGSAIKMFPAEMWYTFIKSVEAGDKPVIVTWLTFGITIPLDVYLSTLDHQAIESAKGRIEQRLSLSNKVYFTEQKVLSDAAYQGVLPSKTCSQMVSLPKSLHTSLQRIFEDYVKHNSKRLPAIVAQYNTIVMQVDLNDLNIPEFIEHHQTISKKIATLHPNTSNINLNEAFVIQISKGGFFFEQSIENNTALIVITNEGDSKIYSSGYMYGVDKNNTFIMSKRYGVTTNYSDMPLIMLKLVYTCD